MPSIGIIANPASGKDIRRLVSYATTIDNNEKVNIVKRIVLAAQSMGVDSIWFMPDTFQIGWTVMDDLECDGKLTAKCHMVDMPLNGTSEDTTRAAMEMERMGLNCCLVLGGDGTSRAVAKGINKMPILPLSTGTNNVYPILTEGTVAGMAAATAAILNDFKLCCIRDKRIEIFRNGVFVDIALIDAVLTDDIWVGARAIWDIQKIRRIFVTRCHPASIGFSSVAGCIEPILDTDDYGMEVEVGNSDEKIIAPVAAGILDQVEIVSKKCLPLGVAQKITLTENCMVALDGERELRVNKGDTLTFTITRNGPWRIKIKETLEEAVRRGLFNVHDKNAIK